MKKYSLVFILLVVALFTVGASSLVQSHRFAEVHFVEGTTLAQATTLIHPHDLALEDYRGTRFVGDAHIHSNYWYDDGLNGIQEQRNDAAKRYVRWIDRKLEHFSEPRFQARLDNIYATAAANATDATSHPQVEDYLTYMEHGEIEKAAIDGCWLTNECPAVSVSTLKLYYQDWTAMQVIESSAIVERVRYHHPIEKIRFFWMTIFQ